MYRNKNLKYSDLIQKKMKFKIYSQFFQYKSLNKVKQFILDYKNKANATL